MEITKRLCGALIEKCFWARYKKHQKVIAFDQVIPAATGSNTVEGSWLSGCFIFDHKG